MTLGAADLPPGVLPFHRGYARGDGIVAAYDRVFVTRGASRPVAGSRILSLEASVELFANAPEVAASVQSLQAMSARGLRRYGLSVAQGIGEAGARVRVARLSTPDVGDRAVALRERIATKTLVADAVEVVFHVGPVGGRLVAYGLPGFVRPAGVIALARLQAAHMRARLAARTAG
jgi:hypothetical protein